MSNPLTLADLHPKWVTGIRGSFPECEGKRGHIGVSFDCPHCRIQRLVVLFDPPIDDDVLHLFANWAPIQPEIPRWSRTGDTFETITLQPSINTEVAGHWHGWIEHGEIR